MIKEINNKRDYQNLCKGKNISFLQRWEWGELKEPLWKAIRYELDGYPALVLLRKIPMTGKFFAYIPRLFNDKTFNKRNLEELLKELRANGSISHVIYDPEIKDKNLLKKLKSVGFKSNGEQLQLSNTNIIDLEPAVDELMSKFSSKTRNKIRKPQKEGCEIEVLKTGKDSVDRFWEIMTSIVKNTEYISHPKKYFIKMWEIFSEADMAKIIIAKKGDSDLGVYFVLHNDKNLWELFGGLNSKGREIRGMGYFLKWKTIEYAAKELGLEIYDQWGVAPKVNGDFLKDHPMYHIGRFKEEFMGDHVKYIDQQLIVFSKPSYFVFKVAKFLQSVNIKLRKLLP